MIIIVIIIVIIPSITLVAECATCFNFLPMQCVFVFRMKLRVNRLFYKTTLVGRSL